MDLRDDLVVAPAAASLLAILQFSDSFFPSGATAFSWGLESLTKDGLVDGADDVLQLLTSLIEHRWCGLDRGLMRAAHRAAARLDIGAPDFTEITAIDALCESMTLNEDGRAASRRLGFTQLKVHAGLGLNLAQAYLAQVQARHALGHLPIAQGLIGQGLGLSALEAEAMSAFGQCTSVVGAGIRLGLLGHVDGQRLLSLMRGRIAAVLATEPPTLDDLWSGAPALDLAAMRHEPRTARLFAN